MQENNFEKQVQQKIGELTIKPSAELWQKVAVNIAKGKKDRRMILYLSLLFLFISLVIFITGDQEAGSKTGQMISKNSKSIKSEIDHKINPHPKYAAPGNANNRDVEVTGNDRQVQKNDPQKIEKLNQKIDSPEQLKEITDVSDPASETPQYNTLVLKDAKRVSPQNNKRSSGKTTGKVTALIAGGLVGDLVNEKISSLKVVNTNREELTPVINEVAITAQLVDLVKKDSNDIKEQMIDSMATGANKKVVVLESNIRIKQNPTWKIGVNFSLGIAATQKGYLGIIGTGDGAGNKSYFDAAQITGANTGPSANTTHAPSTIQQGLGLVLGLFVQKNISPKTSLLLGLNYSLYSSSMMIGNKVDSSFIYTANSSRQSNFYYSSGNSKRYKNYFHFLELPVELQFKLSKHNRLPVYLNTGFSIAQLISSNALQFESQTGAYYSDNSVWNKTQLNLSTNLLFALSLRAKNPFLIGPDINFSISKMANSGLFKDRHYSYFGLLVQKRLGN